ncbi:hypothetical protein EV424DRAFT_1343366 [Suillus variegatus]|nr:hypothetical protein EV424DRAFT_1343366 [Suillus variegatus]
MTYLVPEVGTGVVVRITDVDVDVRVTSAEVDPKQEVVKDGLPTGPPEGVGEYVDETVKPFSVVIGVFTGLPHGNCGIWEDCAPGTVVGEPPGNVVGNAGVDGEEVLVVNVSGMDGREVGIDEGGELNMDGSREVSTDKLILGEVGNINCGEVGIAKGGGMNVDEGKANMTEGSELGSFIEGKISWTRPRFLTRRTYNDENDVLIEALDKRVLRTAGNDDELVDDCLEDETGVVGLGNPAAVGVSEVSVGRGLKVPPPEDAERTKGPRMDIRMNGNDDAKATFISAHSRDNIYFCKRHNRWASPREKPVSARSYNVILPRCLRVNIFVRREKPEA